MKNNTYNDIQNQKNAVKLRELIYSLPVFSFEFFRGIEPTTSTRTRIAYAYDLRIFFDFILEYHPNLADKQMNEIEISDLDSILPEHVEMYLDYLNYYKKSIDDSKSIEYQNNDKGKARKLASLRTFYAYFYKKQKIRTNAPSLVDMPKIHEKNITMLEIDEVARLLDEVESGDLLTASQKKYHKHTKIRDLALFSILLGTGMRVSECVGININDIDFEVSGVKITRKGGNEVVLYFGDEVEAALRDYLDQRKDILAASGHEDAFFLSLQNKRLSVRSVQNIVKKYSQLVTKLKNISPHKLRSTYGTNLYRETGDIYLVADVLGHKDVNTTRKHYAKIEDMRRRKAAKIMKLRNT